MLRTLYKDDERYRKYWYTIDNLYTAGDLAVKGKDGYIMILGRADDIIIVAGHNIGTAEVESALVSHKAVAEAAVIGKPDPDAYRALLDRIEQWWIEKEIAGGRSASGIAISGPEESRPSEGIRLSLQDEKSNHRKSGFALVALAPDEERPISYSQSSTEP